MHFWLSDDAGHVLLRRRGRRTACSAAWRNCPARPGAPHPWPAEEALAHAPMPAEWRTAGQVRHGFTHFELHVDLYAARVARIEADGFLHPIGDLAAAALPSVMRKCVRMAHGSAR